MNILVKAVWYSVASYTAFAIGAVGVQASGNGEAVYLCSFGSQCAGNKLTQRCCREPYAATDLKCNLFVCRASCL